MKARKAIPRGQPPQRKKYLVPSRKRPRPRKQDPAKRRFAKHRCQPYLDWLKTQPCAITGKRTREYARVPGLIYPVLVIVDPAHIRERSLGGDDLYNCLPLARHLHNEQEGHDAEFEAKYGVDLKAIATEHAARFLAEFPEFRGAPTE